MTAKFLHKFNPINKSLAQYNLGRLFRSHLTLTTYSKSDIIRKVILPMGKSI